MRAPKFLEETLAPCLSKPFRVEEADPERVIPAEEALERIGQPAGSGRGS